MQNASSAVDSDVDRSTLPREAATNYPAARRPSLPVDREPATGAGRGSLRGRLHNACRGQFRRAVAAAEPVLEDLVLPAGRGEPAEASAMPPRSGGGSRRLRSAVWSAVCRPVLSAALAAADRAAGGSARTGAYVACWTGTFVLAACLADAETVGLAAQKVQRAVAGDLPAASPAGRSA
ncbi:MAG: hypothetical protein BJ554DRAFT_5853 [Olpidium bornovanus]|uniref:Uncharacterized protein n=1 Tax=Olpidium bornovanus TaxID=278681 RepID=A0A8H8DKH0_9FUNG|nr:MAG: hypothetical protein BJ554DRAFT_5853 [Olpidium bornovanus]